VRGRVIYRGSPRASITDARGAPTDALYIETLKKYHKSRRPGADAQAHGRRAEAPAATHSKADAGSGHHNKAHATHGADTRTDAAADEAAADT